MAAYTTIGHARDFGDNLGYMPDPKSAMLAACVQLTKEISAKCPGVQRQCDELMLWLETIERANGIQKHSYSSPRDYSHCGSIYDAVVEALRSNSGEMTEASLYEELVAGNTPKSKLPGFQGNFRRALSNKERDDIEVVKSETGQREDDVIRLRIPEKIPPKRIR